MAKRIFKYVGPSSIAKVLGGELAATLKCSYPRDFNDPYELFLTVDFTQDPEVLAFYADAVGELPQLPTTCFSRSPSVVPMWAHYAQNLEGFALEFDESELTKAFPESGFGDVDYRDSPDSDLLDTLHRAYHIGKPRYVYFLHRGVFSAAYYTKTTCWSYEQERRMVVRETEIRRAGDLMLIDVPHTCISSIIAGPRATAETKDNLRRHAERIDCRYLEMRIGRTSAVPYFLDSTGTPLIFDGDELSAAPHSCRACAEPLPKDEDHCSWCRIDDTHREDAASRNPYRMFHHFGMLESYIKDMEAIRTGARKK